MPRIMIVEDERVLAKNFREKLSANGYEVAMVHSVKDAEAMSGSFAPDVIILDLRLPDGDGLGLLPKLKGDEPSVQVIVVTAHGSERVAVEAMRAGAYEYLTKPVDLEELSIVVNRAIDHQQMSDNLRFLRNREEVTSGLDRIVGESDVIRNLKETIRRLTRSDALRLPNPPTVLITGETGTGKDLVARAIHYHGPRRSRPMIHVNCTALPPTLFESELFGHARGAFTSAAQAKRGLFEVAHGGTIFLDEIGHLDADTQAKLLLAIEQRQIRPVGATETRSIDVHVIAATNRDLHGAVTAGQFRADLYHRLRVVEIHLEPLRNRKQDILPLVAFFLAAHCRRFGLSAKTLSSEAMNLLTRYQWPGNVRELSHLIESTVLQVDGDVIEPGDLRLTGPSSGGDIRIDLPGGRTLRVDFEKGEPKLDEIEQTLLSAAFEYTGHNLSRAARILGITREALRYRLHKHADAVPHVE
jgi:two-component system response regulator AtoC